MLSRDVHAHPVVAVIAGSAFVGSGIAATATGSYIIAAIIGACGAVVVAAIAATTAHRRLRREHSAQRERQETAILADAHHQALEFAQAREAADLADVRSTLNNMIHALKLGDEIRDAIAAGSLPEADVIRSARRSIEENTGLCRLRFGASDNVTVAYTDFQTAFCALAEERTIDSLDRLRHRPRAI